MTEFVGALPASKSMMNRALIARSFSSDLRITGQSKSRDVVLMQVAVAQIIARLQGGADAGGNTYECGDAGTVLRFLALRLARIEGEHILKGSERLFSRPQKELEKILRQLGCDVELRKDSLWMRSYGWRLQGDGLFVSGEESSQFASAVLLSAWDLKTSFPISVSSKLVSEGYFNMTLRMCQKLGMNFTRSGHEIVISPRQKISAAEIAAEIDVSSAFAVAALAIANGRARILNFPNPSLQPDSAFLTFLSNMNIPFQIDKEQLKIDRAEKWQGLVADLNTCPDLLPVLAVLCAYAQSPSELRGLGHLPYKESDRLAKTCELLTQLGARTEVYRNGVTTLKISPVYAALADEVVFDPDGDHRMAMAAAVAREKGAKIRILTPEVVSKSFPEFWQIAGPL